jgi:hypothetical protein
VNSGAIRFLTFAYQEILSTISARNPNLISRWGHIVFRLSTRLALWLKYLSWQQSKSTLRITNKMARWANPLALSLADGANRAA